MGHSMWLMGISGITGLLGFVAALVLFLRARSPATGLFLGGTAIQALIPFAGYFIGQNIVAYMGIISLAHICAAAGLLWYAIGLPKAAAPVPAGSNQNPLLR
jgi:hypothetical protein